MEEKDENQQRFAFDNNQERKILKIEVGWLAEYSIDSPPFRCFMCWHCDLPSTTRQKKNEMKRK